MPENQYDIRERHCMNDFKNIEDKVKENYSAYDAENEDNWHHEVEKVDRKFIFNVLNRFDSKNKVILNAGSGGNLSAKGKIINLDIVEDNIKQFENYIVASVTDIPLDDNSVDIIICVGSVLNYTDAKRTLSEFKRVLKNNGLLILEFERSDSADLLKEASHHQDVVEVTYQYNGQDHPMILYGEKYVKELLNVNGFVLRKKKRFHIASAFLSRLGMKDESSYRFIHLVPILYPFSYSLAHNIILLFELKN